MAKGVGDPDGVIASLSPVGVALRPLSPVHLRATQRPDGGIDLTWIRRSREGWRWLDGIDVPVAEENELYRMEIAASPSAVRLSEVLTMPYCGLSAAQLAELRAAGSTSLEISIRQIGRFAVSDPTTTILPL
jgi:hypothetical protein